MLRLLRRLLNAWEWGLIASVEAFFDAFARAWQTGDGRPRVAAAPAQAAVAQAPAPPRLAAVGRGVDVEAVTGGLVKLGYKRERAQQAAERAAAQGGTVEEIMRRALSMVQGRAA